jgi:hypothetical protein
VYLDEHPLRAIWNFLAGFANWPGKTADTCPAANNTEGA